MELSPSGKRLVVLRIAARRAKTTHKGEAKGGVSVRDDYGKEGRASKDGLGLVVNGVPVNDARLVDSDDVAAAAHRRTMPAHRRQRPASSSGPLLSLGGRTRDTPERG